LISKEGGFGFMEEKNLSGWKEFKSTIDGIREKYGFSEFPTSNDKTENNIVFRGQQDSKWRLETTLERATQKSFYVSEYLHLISHSIHELESFSGVRWNLPNNSDDLAKEIERGNSEYAPYLPYLNYLVYLRHHGYPSPLLDWSKSPYVAAYFAFCDASQTDRVAIFAYIAEMPVDRQIFTDEPKPKIKLEGPYVTTDKRHFAQQAWYTTATIWSEELRQHIFCSHQDVFNDPANSGSLIKITIPAVDRQSALKELNDYNINHFTLFQSEDALVKTLGMKDFSFIDRPPEFRHLTILIAGPYRSGTGDDPLKLAANVAAMEAYALPLFRAGHLPLVGEWLALPLVQLAGSQQIGDAPFNEIFHPIAERLLARCDGVLRVGGPSQGADQMVASARKLGLKVYFKLADVPGCENLPEPQAKP
jgi:hypothetical protein